MSSPHFSRRNFIKISGLALAGAGLAVGGISLASPIDTTSAIPLPSYSNPGESASKSILIAYASAFGSTGEVAVEMGHKLSQRNLRTDVRPIRENPSVGGYDEVVIGSAVQYGKWLPEAVEFVVANQRVLKGMPVALFCVSIANQGSDPENIQKRLAYLDDVRRLVQPVDEAFFPGRFDRRGGALLMPDLLARLVPTFNFLNLETVRAWAGNLQLPQVTG